MKWSNGLKKGFRYVLLSLCILGVVLQPVSVFADSYTLSYSDYINFLDQVLDPDVNITLVDNPADLPSALTSLPEYHEDSIISYFYNSGYPFIFISDIPSGNIGFQVTSGFTSVSLNSNFGGQGGTTYIMNLNGSFDTVTYYVIGAVPPANTNAPVFVYIGEDFTFLYGSNTYTVTNNTSPNYPSVDPSNPESVTGADYPLNIYTQLGLMFSLNFNSYTPDGSVHFNPTWVGVGQALTYDYLCKTNKDSSTVNITLADGTEVSLNNYLYGEPDYTSSLSTIQSTLNTISSRANTTNTRLNTLNTSINNQMNSVNNKLDAAFPSNQAAINDFIAEDVMDDTDGKGLTISKIANTKSVLDEGVDTFEVDSSGISWSDPFSALLHLDWAWFSETTALNLQAQDQASLLNDIDYSGLPYYNSVNSYYDDGH